MMNSLDKTYSDGLSLNIIHTRDGKHEKLPDNDGLLDSLLELCESGVEISIRILINDPRSIDDFRENVTNPKLSALLEQSQVLLFHSGEKKKLGSARDVLQNFTDTRYYLNIDEDDNFNVSGVISLVGDIHKLDKDKVTMIGFNWKYRSASGDIAEKLNPYIESEVWSRDDVTPESPVLIKSLVGLCSWNLIHNAELYSRLGLVRPNVNKYDDCLFYNKLVNAIGHEMHFYRKCIYNYNAVVASMSAIADVDPDLSYIIDYSLDTEPVKITKII